MSRINKRSFIITPILFLALSSSILADYLDQRATGYDWTIYTQEVKVSLMKAMFDYYGLDEHAYSIEKAVTALDAYYDQKHQESSMDILAEPFLLAFATIAADKKMYLSVEPEKDDHGVKMGNRSVSELGVIYVGMPKGDLEKAGYSQYLQKAYRKEGNEEWITYLNWETEDVQDTITFYIVDDKVKGWQE